VNMRKNSMTDAKEPTVYGIRRWFKETCDANTKRGFDGLTSRRFNCQQIRNRVRESCGRLSAASSNSNYESTNATQPLPLDTQGNDQGARRSLLEPAEIRSRQCMTKTSVWFLRTTLKTFQLPMLRMADRPRLLPLLRSNFDKS
jgi:hypothetical protein